MKKFYLFFMALLGLFVSTNANADSFDQTDLAGIVVDGYTADLENPLITDVMEQLYGTSGEMNPCCDTGEGNEWALLGESQPTEITNRNAGNDFWHSNWHNGDQPAGSHYFQVMMTDDLDPKTLITFVFKRRAADNDHTIEWSVRGTNDINATKEQCEELAYVSTPFKNNTEVIMAKPFKRSEYKYLRFYSEVQQGNGYGSRGYFHMARFNIYPVKGLSPEEVAWSELEKVYQEYSVYEGIFTGHTGTMPGDYSEEAVEAFNNALMAYLDINPDVDTPEKMNECGQAIKDTYAAILASKVPFTAKNLPNGYYRLRAGMTYSTGDKYMCVVRNTSDQKLYGYWATPDLSDPMDAIQVLWKVEAKSDTTFDIMNMYSDARFTKVERSTNVVMSTESDSLIAIDAAGYNHDEELAYVNIRLASQPAKDYFYIHQGGHSDGGGEGSYLVGWSTSFDLQAGPKASEWYFEAVPDDEAAEIIEAYAPYKNKDLWLAEFKYMMQQAPGMLEIAKDVHTIKLLTDGAQFSSPYSHNDQAGNGTDGGNITDGVLIDGNTSTYWHSAWQNIPEGKHYFQVEMPEDFDAEQAIYMSFTRRNANNNQITDWSFKGTNDPEATEEDCEQLGTFNSPWNSSNATESFKSEPFKTQGYKYIRFYQEANNAGSVFFHLSEFQLGYDVDNPNSQYVAMGDIAKNLEKAITDFADIADEELDYETNYQVLKSAYDAFLARYVNPAALRDTISLAEAFIDKVVEGTNPGFYPVGSSAALAKTIADSKAYDQAGAYSPAKNAEYLYKFKSQLASLEKAAIKVQAGKWYRIRFGTEEEFDNYGWGKDGNTTDWRMVDGEQVGEIPYNEAIFGKYLTVATWEDVEIDQNDDGTPVYAHVITPIAKDKVALGNYIHGDDLADITDPDMALFRFVNIGDTALAIQNKATGLFLSRPVEGGDVRLSIYPALYEQKVIGWGQNSFFAKTLLNAKLPPLHFARNYNILTQWGGDTSGWGEYDNHRGAFYVEEVEDVAADYTFGDFNIKAWPGAWSARTYPVTVTAKSADEGQMWTVSEITRTPDGTDEEIEAVAITLVPIKENVAPAGRPFIYIKSGDYLPAIDREEDAEPETAKFSFQFDLKAHASTSGLLKGVLDRVTVGAGFATIGNLDQEDGSVIHYELTKSNATVASNAAYIGYADAPFARKATFSITLNAEGDGIAAAIENVSRIGGIYTIDGRLVKARGNLNDMQNLPKGAYILNGTKVLVK